jgi:hypothetical protein
MCVYPDRGALGCFGDASYSGLSALGCEDEVNLGLGTIHTRNLWASGFSV